MARGLYFYQTMTGKLLIIIITIVYISNCVGLYSPHLVLQEDIFALRALSSKNSKKLLSTEKKLQQVRFTPAGHEYVRVTGTEKEKLLNQIKELTIAGAREYAKRFLRGPCIPQRESLDRTFSTIELPTKLTSDPGLVRERLSRSIGRKRVSSTPRGRYSTFSNPRRLTASR